MRLRVRYFASIREALGAGETLEAAEGTRVGELRDALIARGGPHAEVLARGRSLRCALNQTLVDDGGALRDGDELAFFPPVTGG